MSRGWLSRETSGGENPLDAPSPAACPGCSGTHMICLLCDSPPQWRQIDLCMKAAVRVTAAPSGAGSGAKGEDVPQSRLGQQPLVRPG